MSVPVLLPRNVSQIEDQPSLNDFCLRCRQSRFVAIDTEFVSENRYRPELCLLQVASDDEIAIVDTLKIRDLNPFWEMLTGGDHTTITHAAREEFLFCYRAIGRWPKKLFDIQLAAAFVGFEYPVSYSNLVTQITGQLIAKGETRTDWKHRPLSQRQISYAIADVEYLHPLCVRLSEMLDSTQRTTWYFEEIEAWIDNQIQFESEPQWHRVSGASKLNRRSLANLRELWMMRDAQAQKSNRSPKRVIPDDLLIELAKRGSPQPVHFKSIRGFENRVHRDLMNLISEAIQRASDLPDSKLPPKMDRCRSINLGLLGQFLTTILGVVCQKQKIAPNLVGTAQDLRDLAAWRMGQFPKESVPSMSKGWRAEIVGTTIEKAFDGMIALRVDNPSATHPLSIEELNSSAAE